MGVHTMQKGIKMRLDTVKNYIRVPSSLPVESVVLSSRYSTAC